MNQLKAHLENLRTQIAVLTVLFIVAYYIPLKTMVTIWWKNEDYSYGFIIPLASAYLLWEKRKSLGNIPVRSAWGLFPLLVLFVLISLYGILGSSGNVSMPSVPLLIIVFTGFCFGLEAIKRLSLPLGLLFFMVPVPAFIDRTLGMYLKSISSKLGGALIGLFNISVHVSGNIIDLGVTQLQVVDACSGLRYLFPLIALGILYAYFFERLMWRRLLCVLVTIPLGVFANALRIGLTGVLTERFGTKVAEGFFHGFSGWAMFVFALFMLFLISRLLNIFTSNKAADRKETNTPRPSHLETAAGRKTTGAFFLSAAILSCVAFFSLSTSALPPMTIEGGVQSFPLRIGKWEGKADIIDPVIVQESGAEEAFNGHYVNGSGGEISLYMGYRSSAFLANENYFHSPTVCMPSAGWVEQEVKKRRIRNVPYFNDLDVTQMIMEKGGTRLLVYFWFQTKDKATYDKNINRFHLSLHAIRRDNTHALFIRPITPFQVHESIPDAEMRMDQFVREMMPVLLQFLKEKQVQE